MTSNELHFPCLFRDKDDIEFIRMNACLCIRIGKKRGYFCTRKEMTPHPEQFFTNGYQPGNKLVDIWFDDHNFPARGQHAKVRARFVPGSGHDAKHPP